MYDKAIKFTKEERKALNKKGAKLPDFKKHERPNHDPKRKVHNSRCAFCGYKPRHVLYVCPTCGACQACGTTNPTGNVDQSCQVCGNGESVPPISVPTTTVTQSHDRPQIVKREAFERPAHKKKQSSSSVNIRNIQ
jgi:hypothetical protein